MQCVCLQHSSMHLSNFPCLFVLMLIHVVAYVQVFSKDPSAPLLVDLARDYRQVVFEWLTTQTAAEVAAQAASAGSGDGLWRSAIAAQAGAGADDEAAVDHAVSAHLAALNPNCLYPAQLSDVDLAVLMALLQQPFGIKLEVYNPTWQRARDFKMVMGQEGGMVVRIANVWTGWEGGADSGSVNHFNVLRVRTQRQHKGMRQPGGVSGNQQANGSGQHGNGTPAPPGKRVTDDGADAEAGSAKRSKQA